MKEVLRSNDPVELSWATATLEGADLKTFALDQNDNELFGNISSVPVRLMVVAGEYDQAIALLEDARAQMKNKKA